jgi:hypothetical protein
MILEIDLLVVDNLIRHIENKLNKLNEIKNLCSETGNNLIHESFLAIIISYFEASLIDVIQEYILARPYQFYDKIIDRLKSEKNTKVSFIGSELEEGLIELFISDINCGSIKEKIEKLKEICDIKYNLGNEHWEFIRECIARRNCLIHNDLIVNKVYFNQAGNKATDLELGKKLTIDINYLSNSIKHLSSILTSIRDLLKTKYALNTHISAVKNLWDYLFENHYPLLFDSCWKIQGGFVEYKGPNIIELEEMVSQRTICLFTAWMTLFNSYGCPDVKYFSSVFYNSKKGRELYSQKFKYLINSFEKIDFQEFNIKGYEKKVE